MRPLKSFLKKKTLKYDFKIVLALPHVRASPWFIPSQRGSSVLSPSLALVSAAQWSSRRILLYIVDRCERGKIAERTVEPR